MIVKVAKLGTRVVEVCLEDGATVSQALQAAEVSTDGFDLRVAGAPVTADFALVDGDILTMVPAIKGG